jgi:hypothetical protein
MQQSGKTKSIMILSLPFNFGIFNLDHTEDHPQSRDSEHMLQKVIPQKQAQLKMQEIHFICPLARFSSKRRLPN